MKTGEGQNWKQVGIGFKSGMLTVIGKPARPPSAFTVECSCGVLFDDHPANIIRQLSCGCSKRKFAGTQNVRHGECGTPTYRSWRSMITRCQHPHKNTKKAYFDRGITVCDHWLESYENFKADMGLRPEGKTIDRIDSNGHYEPGNCRWSTPREQQNNKTNTPFLTHNGETLSLMDWSRRNGWGSEVIRQRLAHGWSESDAVSVPKEARRPRELNLVTRKLVRNASRRLSRARRRRERKEADNAARESGNR